MKTIEKENKEMNRFLKGIHMGANTFKAYLEKAKDPELKQELIHVIDSFKRHEKSITNIINSMGIDAADTLGFFAAMGSIMEKIKLLPVNSDLEICQHAVDAIQMGIKQGRKFIQQNSNLNPDLLNEAQGVVNDYDNHLRKMQQIMQKYN